MDRVGDYSHTVGKPSSNQRYDGEGEIDEECGKNILPATVTMQMYVIVRHVLSFLKMQCKNT